MSLPWGLQLLTSFLTFLTVKLLKGPKFKLSFDRALSSHWKSLLLAHGEKISDQSRIYQFMLITWPCMSDPKLHKFYQIKWYNSTWKIQHTRTKSITTNLLSPEKNRIFPIWQTSSQIILEVGLGKNIYQFHQTQKLSMEISICKTNRYKSNA